jgi:hypothetical protein
MPLAIFRIANQLGTKSSRGTKSSSLRVAGMLLVVFTLNFETFHSIFVGHY